MMRVMISCCGSSHLSDAINHYLIRPSCGPLWICDSKEYEEEHIQRGPQEGRIRGVQYHYYGNNPMV